MDWSIMIETERRAVLVDSGETTPISCDGFQNRSIVFYPEIGTSVPQRCDQRRDSCDGRDARLSALMVLGTLHRALPYATDVGLSAHVVVSTVPISG